MFVKRLALAVCLLVVSGGAAVSSPARAPVAHTPAPDPAVVKGLLCRGKCEFARAPRFVGQDPEKRDVFLVAIALPEVKSDDGFEPAEPCIPEAYSLVHLASGGRTGPKSLVEKVMTLREDGCFYGMGGGSEEVDIEQATMTVHRDAGSNWRGSRTTTWRLLPKLERTSERATYYSRITTASQTTTTDFLRGVTRKEITLPLCGDGDESKQPEWAADVIPRAPERLIVDSAASTGRSRGGFVVHGARGTASDAEMTVSMLDDRTLVVEAEEASFTQGKKSWVFDDHVEIWMSEDGLPAMVVCAVKAGAAIPEDDLGGPLPRIVQWGVRVTDGAVFSGAGRPNKSLLVERQPLSPTRVRLTIKLPARPALLTVVYSDSDDGKTQKRMIATSNLTFDEPRSLGVVADR
jgi:hypothetical protein